MTTVHRDVYQRSVAERETKGRIRGSREHGSGLTGLWSAFGGRGLLEMCQEGFKRVQKLLAGGSA